MSATNQGSELISLRNRLGELERKGKNMTDAECSEVHDTIDQIKELDEEALTVTRDNSSSYSSLSAGVLPMPEAREPWSASASAPRGIGVAQGAEYRQMFPDAGRAGRAGTTSASSSQRFTPVKPTFAYAHS